ncbi:MAG: ATP-dependent helicase [Patescibacteria group bacterium]
MAIDYKKALNEEQMRAVENGGGPCLVLAGAGSGKTRTIVYRVAWLLEHGVSSSSILLVTFTNKAAREMTDRLEVLLGEKPQGLWAGTFHAIGSRVLRMYGREIGVKENFTILDSDDSERLLKTCIKSEGLAERGRFPSASVLQSAISYSKNSDKPFVEVLEERLPHFDSVSEIIRRIAKMYEDKKRESGCLDFDDLLVSWRELLAKSETVKSRLAKQFQYILVDEFQDTNVLQADIVSYLASHHNNLLVVGDDAQSIYSFRAANVRNILDFEKRFPNTRTYRLEENYRSVPEILEVANASIVHNENRLDKTLRTTRLSAARPRLVFAPSVREEAKTIADAIDSLLFGGMPAENIAVLFRAEYQSQALEFELLRRGHIYEYRGGLRFFERAHIKDALAALRILENPKDEASWLRILSLAPGIGPTSASQIFSLVSGVDAEVWTDTNFLKQIPGRAMAGFKEIAEWFSGMQKVSRVEEQVRAFVNSSYAEYLEREYPDATDRLQDLVQLASFADSYETRTRFLEEATLSDAFGVKKDVSRSRLVLSTIHQAKGLEWEAVFVISLTDGAFPSRRSFDDDAAIEEERRLFYVAVTRARTHLTLSSPMRTVGEEDGFTAPSRFVQEIPSSLFSIERKRMGFDTVFASSLSSGDDASQGEFFDEDAMPKKKKGFLSTI